MKKVKLGDPTYDVHVPALLKLSEKERRIIARCLRDSTKVPEDTHPEVWAHVQLSIAHADAHPETIRSREEVEARIDRRLAEIRRKRAAAAKRA